VQDRLRQGGLGEEDFPAVETAVTHHCLPKEIPRGNPHWRLTWLLKDADGLDRVRLKDLDTRRLRFREAPEMAEFAQRLHDQTNGALQPGPDYFAQLWPAALAIESGQAR
jgi:hypothetical protein